MMTQRYTGRTEDICEDGICVQIMESEGHVREIAEMGCSRASCVVCHYGKEFLLVDFPILVQIEFIYHGL